MENEDYTLSFDSMLEVLAMLEENVTIEIDEDEEMVWICFELNDDKVLKYVYDFDDNLLYVSN